MNWKKPRRRVHQAAGAPYDRWAVHCEVNVYRLVRVNAAGWAAPEDCFSTSPVYVGNKWAYTTRIEAERMLAVLTLAGNP